MTRGLRIERLGLVLALALVLTAWEKGHTTTGTPTPTPALPEKIVVLGTPYPLSDAVWMAEVRGFFKEEGLNVEMVPVSSGPAGTEAFRTGVGDVLLVGDLPAINNWFSLNRDVRIMTVIERDAENYWAVTKREITRPQDLIGKKIGTRLGSTGSYFVDVYLKKNGIDPGQVDVLNLETPTLVPALDRGDIDAFFIYEPFPTRAEAVSGTKVHRLSSATGYVVGYAIVTGRRSFLEKYPEAATRLLRAIIKGNEFSANNKDVVIKYFWDVHKVPADISELTYKLMGRAVGLDHQFYSDLCQEFRWAQSVGMRKAEEELVLTDWVWRDGLLAIDPSRAPEPPGRTCPP